MDGQKWKKNIEYRMDSIRVKCANRLPLDAIWKR